MLDLFCYCKKTQIYFNVQAFSFFFTFFCLLHHSFSYTSSLTQFFFNVLTLRDAKTLRRIQGQNKPVSMLKLLFSPLPVYFLFFSPSSSSSSSLAPFSPFSFSSLLLFILFLDLHFFSFLYISPFLYDIFTKL